MRSGKIFVLTITSLYQFNIMYFVIFWHVKCREGNGILKMLSRYFNGEIRRRLLGPRKIGSGFVSVNVSFWLTDMYPHIRPCQLLAH